ncbi:hypothetical protein N0V90_004745 [Kalmusia sp. IMI 367209]|nr:hypothetical protein N0V90_004745 [Kalmusia sp. IMI 367209]
MIVLSFLEHGLFTASMALKVAVLLLESKKKTKWLLDRNDKEHGPEAISGVFDIGLYIWLKGLFLKGFTSLLAMDHLYHLDEKMSSERLYHRLATRFKEGATPGKRHHLAKALANALLWPLFVPALPRLALIGFTFSQPFFIASVLYTISHANEDGAKNDSFGLIGASIFIYTGIALSRAFYGYLAQRSVFMARGCLASTIFDKTIKSQVAIGDNASAVTLMSTDVERIMRGIESFHELWANTLEAGLGCWLLQRKLGFAFLSPVIIIAICAAAMAWVGRTAGTSQALWMARIQTRVGMTSKVIENIKQVKIAGMAESMEKLIRNLRTDELAVGNKFRKVQVVAATIAFSPQALSSVFAFALAGRNLNVTTTYESLSYMILLSSPLASLFQEVPNIIATFTCLQRIQAFLEVESRQDFRIPLDIVQCGQRFSPEHATTSNFERAETFGPNGSSPPDDPIANSEPVLTVTNASFGWRADEMVLKDINIVVRFAQITLVVGPTACGKSTLCRAVLGDVPHATGKVQLHPSVSSVSFCDQVPFLISGTLKQNIVRHHRFSQKRYDDVVWAAALDHDVACLSHGHDTDIGSSGTTLSGGQRARVSLARALYHESSILVLDDVFSSLDNSTANEVLNRSLGPGGIIRSRGSSVILVSDFQLPLPLVDHIVVLGADGTILEQGSQENLKHHRRTAKVSETKDTGLIAKSNDQFRGTNISQVLPSGIDDTITEALDERSRQLGDFKVYKYYLNSMNKVLVIAMVASCVTMAAGLHLPPVWIGFWAADSFNRSNTFYLGILGLLSSLMLVGIFAGALITSCYMTNDAGTMLHHTALSTVMHAPLGFFTATDTGTIINLFSQDTTIIDSQLTMYLLNFVFGITGVLGSGTNFLDTMKGIATIRAFGWVKDEVVNNRSLLDTSQRPAYLLAMIQQCLILVLNLVVAILATTLTSLATQLHTKTGFTGASLVSLLQFGQMASNLMYSYTALETSIGAVSRLKTFNDKVIPEDREGEDIIPPISWPHQGAIELRDVSATYKMRPDRSAEKSALALRQVTLQVQSGEKVAICGRTGSGKSSLIMLLLRLLTSPPSSIGTCTIDNINIFSLKRSILRSRIIAIPQDCVFLPNGSSIKSNIDPTDGATDVECLSILEMVQLTGFVNSKGGLHSPMIGDELSAGQQQLFSLGRAIYRRRARAQASTHEGGLLLLDEISSAVDRETEVMMLDIIKREFAGYTIVVVAHRLQMLLNFADKIVVMDQGSVVEIGTPQDLLAEPNSNFGRLYSLGS